MISPNMNLPVPVDGTTPGPDWATDVVASLNIVDSHAHTTGQGVPITPDALNINASLPMGNNYLTETGAVSFTAQSAPLSGSLTGYLYEAGVDLYYNDGSGNQVRITQSGSVAGSSGTITGLPSGTASASYGGSTFTFQSATNTPATINVGPIITGAASASSKTVTISAPGGLAANYAVTLPLALPGSTSFLNCDTSGNTGFVNSTGSGSVVLDNSGSLTTPNISAPNISSPDFSGTAIGTITSGSYAPTISNGASGTAAASGGTFFYTRLNDRVTVWGDVTQNTSAGGLSNVIISLPINPASNFPSAQSAYGVVTPHVSVTTSGAYMTAIASSKTVETFCAGLPTASSVRFTVNFTYSCT